jgi:putative transposase
MPQYIRAFVPGGTFFFTVTLLERRRRLLTENIDHLREVFKAPADAAHLPSRPSLFCPIICIASGPCLPEMRISPAAGMISRPDLPHKFPEGKDFQHGVCRRENGAFGSDAFGNMSSVMMVTMSVM